MAPFASTEAECGAEPMILRRVAYYMTETCATLDALQPALCACFSSVQDTSGGLSNQGHAVWPRHPHGDMAPTSPARFTKAKIQSRRAYQQENVVAKHSEFVCYYVAQLYA